MSTLPSAGYGLSALAITRFIWTTHAENRRATRMLDRSIVEHQIQREHDERRINRGRADWRIDSLLPDGRRLAVVYDHPHREDHETARIVSLWDH